MFHIHEGIMGFELGDSLKDVANTMFWPTVIFLAASLQEARRRMKVLGTAIPVPSPASHGPAA